MAFARAVIFGLLLAAGDASPAPPGSLPAPHAARNNGEVPVSKIKF